MRKLLLALSLAIPLLAQQKDDGDQVVSVPKKYVSAEGLSHQAVGKASEWIGIGKEIGIATREGLESVVDVSEKFGTTNVGRFVMIMVAWKVIGRQAAAIIIGIPLWIAGIFLWTWSLRKFFFGSTVLVKVDKAAKTKEYADKPPYEFSSGDARTTCGVFHAIFLAVWCIIWITVVFV